MYSKKRIGVGLAATAAVLLLSYCNPRLDNDRVFRDTPRAPVVSVLTEDPLGPGDKCQEDDECWDCHADGNGICGTDRNGE